MNSDLILFDENVRSAGYRRLCGVDEVGRGPLAGPVVAAAVILDITCLPEGLNDSKKLSQKKRVALEELLLDGPHAIAIGVCTPGEIDKINILQASLLAMKRAVTDIGQPPDFVLVDGNKRVPFEYPQETVVGGDGRSASIAAASIIAKEYRDRLMANYALEYPGYGFESNMGYPTTTHRAALAELGPTPIHRRTFKGVRELLLPEEQLGQMSLL